MPTTTLHIETRDGACATELITPSGAGPWPLVVFCHDAGGPRPAMSEMATRIAGWGYCVAIPDLYHRSGPVWQLFPADAPRTMATVMSLFGDPGLRAAFEQRLRGPALAYDNLRVTVGAVIDGVGARPEVRGGIGTTGYCMGGNVSFRIATLFGERIAACAAFHAGGLVTPEPDSPHTRAAAIRARVYVAGASHDASFSDQARQELSAALAAAHVEATVETYPGRHGFAVPDSAAYDRDCAARHDVALHQLLEHTRTR